MTTYDVVLTDGTIICGVLANDLVAYVEYWNVAIIVVSGLGEIIYDVGC